MKLSLTAKDKTLISVAICLIIILLAYLYGYSNLTDRTTSLETEIDSLRVRYNDLRAKENNAEQYEADALVFEEHFQNALLDYATGASQKDTLIFTTWMEERTGVWLNAVSLNEPVEIYEFGAVGSTNPGSIGQIVYFTDLTGYQKTTAYSYACSYEQVKAMLAYIQEYETKYTIDNLSMSYDMENDIVTGVLTISQYIVTGDDRVFDEMEIENVPTGTDNVFYSAAYSQGTQGANNSGNYIINSYDLALTLNSEASDLDSVVLERRGSASSKAAANLNERAAVSIIIEGSNGVYRLRYRVGDVQYPETTFEDGAGFNPGETLDLLVYSSPRDNEEDLAGAEVTVTNLSDMTLNIMVVNEDEENPRFILGETTGGINLNN